MRHGEILDVPGRVLDLMDLQRIDDQPEFLHLAAARRPGLTGELLPVPDHVLDGQPAHDGPEMTGEHVVHPLRHHLLLVEESAGRIGDRHEVVAHLEDDNTAHPQGNPLMGDAIDGQFRLVEVERHLPYRLHTGQDERAVPGDDTEPHALPKTFGLVLGARDDQCFVRLGHSPHQLEQADQHNDGDENQPRHDADDHRHAPLIAVPRRHC